MKKCLVLLVLFFAVAVQAQTVDKVYDANWKETTNSNFRYYSTITRKDSLWLRQVVYFPEKTLQMQGTYKDSACKIKHGEFSYFYADKKLKETGEYINNKKTGLWLSLHNNNMLADSAFYVNGKVKGNRLKWDINGMPTDSIHANEDGTAVAISWFENGQPSQAGRLDSNELKIGKWQFFYPDGKLSAVAVFINDKEISAELYDKNGSVTADTSLKQREASFKGGDAAWRKYLERTINASVAVENRAPLGTYTAVIKFVIDIDGKLINIEPETNMGFGMEKEVMNVIRKAGKWEPAYYYGRPVKAYRRQPLTFQVGGRQ